MLEVTEEEVLDLMEQEPELVEAMLEVIRSMEMDPEEFDKLD
jgi:hypothetical protein